MRVIMAMVAALISGCATTAGIDYAANVAPGNPAAAAIRQVSVDSFDGPLGRWYGQRFEEMLETAVFENALWFEVGDVLEGRRPQGAYSGETQIYPPRVSERYYTSRRCRRVDDETGDCLVLAEIEHVCTRYETPVAVNVTLFDRSRRTLVHDAVYRAAAGDELCYETGFIFVHARHAADLPAPGRRRAGGRRPSWSGARGYPHTREVFRGVGFIPDERRLIEDLTRAALDRTLWDARTDLAPFHQIARAEIMAEALAPEVKADPRFARAADAVRNGAHQTACSDWRALEATYGPTPAVTHNLGACAEAAGDFADAQAHYADAAALIADLDPSEQQLPDVLLNALRRVSERRLNAVTLDAMTAEPPES